MLSMSVARASELILAITAAQFGTCANDTRLKSTTKRAAAKSAPCRVRQSLADNSRLQARGITNAFLGIPEERLNSPPHNNKKMG